MIGMVGFQKLHLVRHPVPPSEKPPGGGQSGFLDPKTKDSKNLEKPCT